VKPAAAVAHVLSGRRDADADDLAELLVDSGKGIFSRAARFGAAFEFGVGRAPRTRRVALALLLRVPPDAL
jgi:hypothetical protein